MLHPPWQRPQKPREGALHTYTKTNAWERRRFDSVFTYLQNNTLSRAELEDQGNGAKNIHYGDVLIKFGECTDVSKTPLPIVTDKNIEKKYASSLLQGGDLVIADTAEDEAVGKCTELTGWNGEAILSGLHTIPCRPVIQFSDGYLGYYMNSSAFHDQLLPLMQGIKVTSISKAALQTTNVFFPTSGNEQQKIGTFFAAISSLITLHQRKLESLQNLKKAFLDTMLV